MTSGVDNMEYVRSPTYIDALIVRDRDDDGNSVGTQDSRLYVQHDANFNVTALLADTSGDSGFQAGVVERYIYDAYGASTVKKADWDNRAGTLYDWRRRFQGLRYDGTGDGMYQVRFRDLSIGTSRWNQQDPVWRTDVTNAYDFLNANPGLFVDPLGTEEFTLKIRTSLAHNPTTGDSQYDLGGDLRWDHLDTDATTLQLALKSTWLSQDNGEFLYQGMDASGSLKTAIPRGSANISIEWKDGKLVISAEVELKL